MTWIGVHDRKRQHQPPPTRSHPPPLRSGRLGDSRRGRYATAWDAGRETRPGMAWWCGWCVIAGVSLPIRREVVVESDASIHGSLLYGDLPALDGAETTDIAEALVQSPQGALRTRKAQVPGSVLSALV